MKTTGGPFSFFSFVFFSPPHHSPLTFTKFTSSGSLGMLVTLDSGTRTTSKMVSGARVLAAGRGKRLDNR